MAILQLLFHEGVGDHCTTILDISTRSAIRKYKRQVVAPQARRLTNKNGASAREYIKHVTRQCRHHRIQERLNCITPKKKLEPITPDDAKDMETFNAQKIKAQTGCEPRCRKIQKPALPFSPPICDLDLWHRTYVNLVKWYKGDQLTNKHVFQEAMRNGIAHPIQLTTEQCAQGSAACWKLLKEHMDNAESLHQEHLQNRYELASNLKDPVKLTQINEIMKREEQHNEWRRIKQVTGDPCTSATNLVQRKEGKSIIDILEEGEMVQEIQDVTERQFELANSTSINTSSLRHSVGFCTSTEYAKDLLQQKIPILRDSMNTPSC